MAYCMNPEVHFFLKELPSHFPRTGISPPFLGYTSAGDIPGTLVPGIFSIWYKTIKQVETNWVWIPGTSLTRKAVHLLEKNTPKPIWELSPLYHNSTALFNMPTPFLFLNFATGAG